MNHFFSSCWFGERLLPIANACINSFVTRGFPFTLYTHGLVEDVPGSVERRDAEELLPKRELVVAHGGFETSADLFAYRVLERTGGWYVDNDVVCNTDRLPDDEVAFGEERIGIINNAVLRFPAHHPAIIDLLEYVATVDPVTAPWGATGPLALTKSFARHDLAKFKKPIRDFYPLHWTDAPKVLFPEFTAAVFEKTAQSPFIHLWGATLREIGFDFSRFLPLKDSYLHILYTRYLDRHVLKSLQPFNEGQFRRSVQDYAEREWQMSLPLL